MVGGTASQQQQQQAPQLTHQSSTAAAHTVTSEEDEVLKRNTDCVYFLASPLTCKKGSECEYRHSDIARVNPRDCWYWLNGNCLNPKCAFRHPPLDGLAGSDMSTPKGPPPPAPAPHATPYATPKQGVACIFFQKGYCLKGPLCPFLHGPPNSVNNKPAQLGPTNPVTEPPKMAQQVTVQKPVESLPPQAKQPPLPARTGVDKKVAPPARVIPPVPPPVVNEQPYNKPNRSAYHGHHASNNERVVSGKDADEYSREISPGFDVLVDNEHEDSGPYYDVDQDMYREHRDYDHYNERDGHFDVDHIDHPEKRPYPRNDRESESDLRHRISKQRRGSDNGMRSGFNRESHADRMPRRDIDRDRDRDSRRDRLDQGSLSSRLRGRIKIPGRSVSPTRENNSRVEREVDVERRHHSRYSPGRPLSLNQTRVRDRINDTKFAGPKRLSELKGGRTEHQPNDDQSLRKRKHTKMEDDVSFEGPKPLSEILKRKRGVNHGNNNNDNNNNVNNNNNTEDDSQKKIEIVPANKEEQHSASVDIDAENEKDKATDGNAVNYGGSEVENEGGMVDEDALLDEELEAYDENRDGDDEYEYEQMEGEEDYNMEEGEEEEYVDEEDVEGDEYGNKEGAVYS